MPAADGDGEGEGEETFHVAREDFVLNGSPHRLPLRRFTGELRQEQVRTWKKLIRVISHELNNPLSPIAYSDGELARRGQSERLPEVLGAIGDRAQHLEDFVRGCADVAKLPAPQPEAIEWRAFVERLQVKMPFTPAGEPPSHLLQADPAQLAQALINLLKNTHESGSNPAAIEQRAEARPGEWRIEVADRGGGELLLRD